MVTFTNRDEPLVKAQDNIIVAVGIDGPKPPDDLQLTLETEINETLNQAINKDLMRQSLVLTIEENPTKAQRDILGPGVLHVQQYDVDVGEKDISADVMNAVHNHIVDHLNSVGFNIVGTATRVT